MMKRKTFVAKCMGFVSVVALSAVLLIRPAIASENDRFLEWQEQDARGRVLDEEKRLMEKEHRLKADLSELDEAIAAANRKRSFLREDIANLQRDIVALKLQLL
jgi:hypothetical protein